MENDKLSLELCIALPADVEFHQAPNTRDGYMGNSNKERETSRFMWALPNYEENKRCVMRIRFIIKGTDGAAIFIAQAPVKGTFEEHSHVFKLLNRPHEIPDKITIYNISVRGKKRSILQTYLAVQYDFV